MRSRTSGWRERRDDPQRIEAVYNVGRRRVWVNGEVRWVRYAHDLRIAADCGNGMLLPRLFRQLRAMLEPGEWMQTVILRDNHASLGTVASGRAGLPHYYPCGTIETSLIWYPRPPAAGRRRASRCAGPGRRTCPPWPRCCAGKAPTNSSFRIGSRTAWTATAITTVSMRAVSSASGKGNRLRGLLGFWDQKRIKQTRVLGYRGGLQWLRHLYNLHSRVRGGFRPPEPGGYLSYLTLHSALVEANEPHWLRWLLDHAVQAFHARYDALVCGFFASDPLSRVPARYRRQCCTATTSWCQLRRRSAWRSERRPDPLCGCGAAMTDKDYLGMWYRARARYGVDDSIHFAVIEPDSGARFDFPVRHREHDGIGGLFHLLRAWKVPEPPMPRSRQQGAPPVWRWLRRAAAETAPAPCWRDLPRRRRRWRTKRLAGC